MKWLRKRWVSRNNQILFIFFAGFVNAQTFQNLVPNGSFESFTLCPDNNSQLYRAAPWTGPRINSSDYYNVCSSKMNVPNYGGISSVYPYYLQAKDGVAYSGIYYYRPTEDYREYAQVELTDTLEYGVCYYVEFFAANAQGPPYATNNVAANFSATWYSTTTLTVNNSILNITSHITNYNNPVLPDTVKWTRISGVYEALGVEKYMVIGNFEFNSQTDTIRIFRPIGIANCGYMFLDAVSVYSIDPNGALPWSYRDTTINKGDSVYIGNRMGGLNFHPQWFTHDGNYLATNAGITVSPTVTSKYYVQYTLCGVQRTDTVKVTVPGEGETALRELKIKDEELKIYPLPARQLLNVECTALNRDATVGIGIRDHMGQALREEEIVFSNKKAVLDVSWLKPGVYVMQIRFPEGILSRKFVISGE